MPFLPVLVPATQKKLGDIGAAMAGNPKLWLNQEDRNALRDRP
jgi:hypothetical protein